MPNTFLRKYKLLLAYDGTCFQGWQVQKEGDTIQQRLQEALTLITRESITVIGAGRTDAGVHALGQVAHFSCVKPLDLSKLHVSLNGLLPKEIRVLAIEEAPSKFHARYGAKRKIYRYTLCRAKAANPLERLYALHVRYPLNLNLLKEAAQLFVGKRDFTSFANSANQGAAAKGGVRHLMRLDVKEEGEKIYLEFEGDGFLYKMVRNIVGILLEVASGKRSLQEIDPLFEARDRKRAGKAAAPHGLCLLSVLYDEDNTDPN